MFQKIKQESTMAPHNRLSKMLFTSIILHLFPVSVCTPVWSGRIVPIDSPKSGPTDGFGGPGTLTSIPDVNGDGVVDFAISAPSEAVSPSLNEVGAVYIFDGSTQQNLHELRPESPVSLEKFGFALRGLPDINGNGAGDILVGAPGVSIQGFATQQGRAYLFDGGSGELIHTLQSSKIENHARFGYAVEGIPDLNEDGVWELLIGVPYDNDVPPPSDQGVVEVIDGKTGVLIRRLTSPAPVTNGRFGTSIARLVDALGNDRTAIVVGAPGEGGNMGGACHVFEGPLLNHVRTFTSKDPLAGAGFGTLVSSTVDFGGFPEFDFAVTEPGRNLVHFLDSSGGGVTPAMSQSLGTQESLIISEMTEDQIPEYVVGRPMMESNFDPDRRGLVEIRNVNLSTTRLLSSIDPMANGQFGSSLLTLPDSNGDGIMELLVGAAGEIDYGSNRKGGRAYLFFSPYDNPTVVADPPKLDFGTIDLNGETGGTLELIVRNDGPADLIISEPNLKDLDFDRSYVYFLIDDESSCGSCRSEFHLPPGQFRKFTILFDPLSLGFNTGTYEAKFDIETNDRNNRVLSIPLTGKTVITTPTPAPAPLPCDSGYYILDSFGGRHRVGDPAKISGPIYFGSDLARDLEKARLNLEGEETFDLVVLDAAGAAHFVAHPEAQVPQMFYFGNEMMDFPEGRAVDLELASDGQGFWVLTDYGGIYRAGSVLGDGPVRVPNTANLGLGFDIPMEEGMRAAGMSAPGGAHLRAISLGVIDENRDDNPDGFIVLDTMGGRHLFDNEGNAIQPGFADEAPENSPLKLLDPAVYAWPFFPGMDIARDLEIHSTQQGATVLDGWGGIHPIPSDQPENPVYFSGNKDPNNPGHPLSGVGNPYIPFGFRPVGMTKEEMEEDAASIFIDLEFSAGCGDGLFVLDKFGGIFAMGSARESPDDPMAPFRDSPYFYPNQYAEAIELFAGDETDYSHGEPVYLEVDLPGLAEGARPLRLVGIPSGSFQMGSPQTERGRRQNEGSQRVIGIGYEFFLGETEITQAQWHAVMGDWPGGHGPTEEFGIGDDLPVYYVSWNNIRGTNGFLERLNRMTDGVFRLPSESEWEYACRATASTRFSFGDSLDCVDTCVDCIAGVSEENRSDFMWYCWAQSNGGFPAEPQPVARLLPNLYSLFDMHGNVREWVEDDYTDRIEAPRDGRPYREIPGDSDKVTRGGGWNDGAHSCRSASRHRGIANAGNPYTGFRVVFTPYQKKVGDKGGPGD